MIEENNESTELTFLEPRDKSLLEPLWAMASKFGFKISDLPLALFNKLISRQLIVD